MHENVILHKKDADKIITEISEIPLLRDKFVNTIKIANFHNCGRLYHLYFTSVAKPGLKLFIIANYAIKRL